MFKKRNDFDQYLKNIRISFPVFHKAERRFFQDFSANVREYQAIHPMSTLSDLEEEFGRPKDIIMDYFYNMNSSSYLLSMKRARYLRIITASVIIFLIAGTIIESYFYYTLYKGWKRCFSEKFGKLFWHQTFFSIKYFIPYGRKKVNKKSVCQKWCSP